MLSLVRSLIPGAGLIILASVAFEGTARDVLWVLAVILDYGLVLAAARRAGTCTRATSPSASGW